MAETQKTNYPVHKTLKTHFADLVHEIQKAPFAEWDLVHQLQNPPFTDLVHETQKTGFPDLVYENFFKKLED